MDSYLLPNFWKGLTGGKMKFGEISVKEWLESHGVKWLESNGIEPKGKK